MASTKTEKTAPIVEGQKPDEELKEPQTPAPDTKDEAPTGEAVSTGDALSDISATIMDNRPDVNSAMIMPTIPGQTAPDSSADNSADDHDPWQRDENGEIKKSKATGKPLKKRGRKPGASKIGGSGSGFDSGRTSEPQPENAKAESYKKAGRVAAGAFISLNIMAFGEEFKPDDQAEIEGLRTGFADYFESQDITDLPPGMALVMVMGAYMVPRFTRPKAQARVLNIWGRAKLWYSERKRAKKTATKTKAGVVEESGEEK